MSITEQLRRIVKAAPNLPIQMVSGIALIIAIPILTFKGIEGLTYNWTEGTAKPIEHSQIQERIREGEQEYFFKIFYAIMVNNKEYRTSEELGFRTEKEAQAALNEKMDKNDVKIWYSTKNPDKATFKIEQTYWQAYFLTIGLLLLVLAYFRWLFLKYYELEIEE